MFDIFKNKEKDQEEGSLGDEKENKGLVFILVLIGVGLVGIIIYAFQDGRMTRANKIMITLFFVAGAFFTLSSLVGFLFGIPRTTVIDETEKSKSRYIGNDNLLQVSDWITKIIIGLGLTQIHQIPGMLRKVAKFIMDSTHVSNEAYNILVIMYFACLGFLFGYLWTRLYFIRMLRASEYEVINEDESTAQVKTEITTDIKTGVTTTEEKK
jgi:hypothetical protein